MRWLVVALVIANLCYLGWELYRDREIAAYNRALRNAVQQPLRRASDALPEAGSRAASLPLPLPVEKVEVPQSQGVEPLAAVNPLPPDSAPEQADCLVVGPLLDIQQFQSWSERLTTMGLLVRPHRNSALGPQQYLLYLGPIPDLEKLVEITQRLEKDGVEEYRVMNKGNLRNSISLGIYHERRAAETRLAEFLDLGYPAVMTPYLRKQVYWLALPSSVELPQDVRARLQTIGLRAGPCAP